MTAYRLTRDVRTTDEEFTTFNLDAGTIVYQYRGATYGVIGYGGLAVTLEDGVGPFGEIPVTAMEPA